jgi:hypothetical protein
MAKVNFYGDSISSCCEKLFDNLAKQDESPTVMVGYRNKSSVKIEAY